MKRFFLLFLLSWNIAPMYAQDVKLPPFDAVPFGNVYGQEFPRVNPSYCQGFNIDYPIVPGLAFEIGSTQEIHWSFNKSVEFPSDYLVRIRLMNSTQHFHYIIQGFSRNVTFFYCRIKHDC
jgi:hypothetical protein